MLTLNISLHKLLGLVCVLSLLWLSRDVDVVKERGRVNITALLGMSIVSV